jgi:hypothetical protein
MLVLTFLAVIPLPWPYRVFLTAASSPILSYATTRSSIGQTFGLGVRLAQTTLTKSGLMSEGVIVTPKLLRALLLIWQSWPLVSWSRMSSAFTIGDLILATPSRSQYTTA